ncbi:hypothetical protein ACVBEH_09540 [Roseateles sp. GG27B]
MATATLMLSGIASQAQATVVLDTFGPGDTSTGSTWSVYRQGSSSQEMAVAFTLTTESKVDSILSSITGTGDVNVGITTYAGAIPSSTWLYSTTVTNPRANFEINPTGWTLGAGSYWLTASATEGSLVSGKGAPPRQRQQTLATRSSVPGWPAPLALRRRASR